MVGVKWTFCRTTTSEI